MHNFPFFWTFIIVVVSLIGGSVLDRALRRVRKQAVKRQDY